MPEITAQGCIQSGFLYLLCSAIQREKGSPAAGSFHPLGFLEKGKPKEKDNAVLQKDASLAGGEQSELELPEQREGITAWLFALLLLL